MGYTVKIAPQALSQMQEIVQYISKTLQSPENAERWLMRMQKELAALSSMPASVPLTEEEPWHSQGVHKMVVGKFLAYFWIDEPTQIVWVTAIVYGKRDQRQQLQQMGM